MCDDQQVRMRCMPVIHGVTRVPRPPITYKGRVGRRIKHSSVPASSQSSAIRVQCMSVWKEGRYTWEPVTRRVEDSRLVPAVRRAPGQLREGMRSSHTHSPNHSYRTHSYRTPSLSPSSCPNPLYSITQSAPTRCATIFWTMNSSPDCAPTSYET